MTSQSTTPTVGHKAIAGDGSIDAHKAVADSHQLDDDIHMEGTHATGEVADNQAVKSSRKRINGEDECDPDTSTVNKRQRTASNRVTRSQTRLLELNNVATNTTAELETSIGNDNTANGSTTVINDTGANNNTNTNNGKTTRESIYLSDRSAQLHISKPTPEEVRDYFGSQVIITTIGGGRERDVTNNQTIRTKDQTKKHPYYKALNNGLQQQLAIVGIAGARNSLFPVKPPYEFNVLDHFHVTDIWPEHISAAGDTVAKVFKVRLEKVNLTSRSWWAPKGANSLEAGEFEIGEYSCASRDCATCKTASKEMYKQGWTCLNDDCPMFFNFAVPVVTDELQYNDDFLRERRQYNGGQLRHELRPPLPTIDDDTFSSAKRFKKGVVCDKCGCCCRRLHWWGWECENKVLCDFTHQVPVKPVEPEWITQENMMRLTANWKKSNKFKHARIDKHKKCEGGKVITTWFLPNVKDKDDFIGTVTRIRPSKEACDRIGGLGNLYTQLQQDENTGLERRPVRNAGCRNEEVTSHFTVNFGAPYKFTVVIKKTNGFQKAPEAILESLLRLTWAGETAVKTTREIIQKKRYEVTEDVIPTHLDSYNEMLVLGYFEDSQISAHDDGEKELGPNVATLSLGSPSLMKFMPKKNVDLGDNGDECKRSGRAALSIILKHGDMLVMHGEQIQKLYLHSVVSLGTLRFALTCRHIRPETILDEEQRNQAFEDAKIPEKWAAIRYNGEADRFESRATGKVVACPNPGPKKKSNDTSHVTQNR
ncbi:hypothetical protein F4804DRAFT_351906 [Jackrogersella minutella]|nr:hypothetical protein F4804DRAFT_351906 [Jackrogersella minutella]